MQNSVQEVLETARLWLDTGHGVELVTVVRTWGSSPRPVGSIAVVRDDGVLVGSVSGGCIEKQLAQSFQGQNLARAHLHKVDDDQARRFGLACGGELELVFESLEDKQTIDFILQQLSNRQRLVRQVTIGDGVANLSMATPEDRFAWDGQTLRQILGPTWRLVLVGAGQLSRFTAQFAHALDFEVLVIEPRQQFRDAWSLKDIPVLDAHPDEATLKYANDPHCALLTLSHDPNIDDLALIEGLPSQAFFVGALGSSRNYEKRCLRLRALDVPAEAIARLRGPVGLAIGSRTSAEIAISILAELIQVRNSLANRPVSQVVQ